MRHVQAIQWGMESLISDALEKWNTSMKKILTLTTISQ